jgi:hypothetical protein
VQSTPTMFMWGCFQGETICSLDFHGTKTRYVTPLKFSSTYILHLDDWLRTKSFGTHKYVLDYNCMGFVTFLLTLENRPLSPKIFLEVFPLSFFLGKKMLELNFFYNFFLFNKVAIFIDKINHS